jgi:hypothetical protein
VFTVNSALVSFASFSGATGSASASVTVTDGPFGDGATLSPAGPSMYTSYYNGVPGVGTTFASLLSSPVTAAGFSTASANEDYNGGGFWPIAGSVIAVRRTPSFGRSSRSNGSGGIRFASKNS